MRFTVFMAGPLDVWVDEANDAAGVAMVRLIGAVIVADDTCVKPAGV